MANSRKKLVVLCDGTWCGRETGTESNITLIAEAIGISIDLDATTDGPQFIEDPSRKLRACYFAGVGLGGTFLEYLIDGATASDIGVESMKVYEYIVNNYDDQTDIWMFGLSRGSFTVRAVAGMINNAGIVNKSLFSDEDKKLLVDEAYAIYRSPYAEDGPGKPRAKAFAEKVSWQVASPVAVMAIIDTVGGLGIPKLNAGVGFEWPEFYDQNVSSVVKRIYHARSIHDRLWIFEPCRASRSPEFQKEYGGDTDFLIHERWFPGCHYDLGRQKFKFFRDGVNIVEKFFFTIPNKLTKPVMPNLVCADLVLEWLYQCVDENDSFGQIFKAEGGAKTEIKRVQTRLSGNLDSGSGDVYNHIEQHTALGPFTSLFGSWAVNVLDTLTSNVQLGSAIQEFLGVKTILNVLFAVKDRRITDSHADIVELHRDAAVLGGQQSISAKASLQRYPSLTEVNWKLIKRVVGDVKKL